MKYQAILRFARISPKKARLIVNSIRGKNVIEAESVLKFSKTKAAKLILKLLKSAQANAKVKDAEVENLELFEIKVDQAPVLKRRKIRSRGRADLMRRRTSHITIVLSEVESKISKKSSPGRIKKIKKKGAENGSKNKSQKSKARSK